jgi:hypothetical protein
VDDWIEALDKSGKIVARATAEGRFPAESFPAASASLAARFT